MAVCGQDCTARRLSMQTRKDSAKSSLEEPFAVHDLCVLTKSEEGEHAKSYCNLNPAVEVHFTAGWYQHNVPPLWTVNQAPAVWKQRRVDRVEGEDVELERDEDYYERH